MKNTTKTAKKVFSLMLVVIMCLSIVPMTDLTIGARAFEDSEYWTEHGLTTDQTVVRFYLNGAMMEGGVQVYDTEEKIFYHVENYSEDYYDMVPENSMQLTEGRSFISPNVKVPDGYSFRFSCCLILT